MVYDVSTAPYLYNHTTVLNNYYKNYNFHGDSIEFKRKHRN